MAAHVCSDYAGNIMSAISQAADDLGKALSERNLSTMIKAHGTCIAIRVGWGENLHCSWQHLEAGGRAGHDLAISVDG